MGRAISIIFLILLWVVPCGAGIVTSEITENMPQRGNYRYVSYQYTFDNGDIISFYSMSKPLNYDVDAGLIEYRVIAEQQVIDRDDGDLMRQIENGQLSPLNAEPAHPDTMDLKDRKRRLMRKLLRYVAGQNDLKLVRKVFYPVWYWLKFESGYTAQQIANYLNISLTKLQEVNARFQRLHDHLVLIDDDEPLETIE